MRASEESTKQRLDRWRELRDHLRDQGLDEDPPDDLLLDQEPTTRPDVRLVAYYDEITQVSLGKTTATGLMGAVLAVFFGVWALTGMDQWLNDGQQPLIGGIVGILLAAAVAYWILRPIKFRKGRLCLTLEELSLSLPDGNWHTQWSAVYSVSVDQRRKWFSRRWPWVKVRKEPCVRMELDDGVVAWLHLCADECQPLADLMTDFLLCARNGGQPLRERAAAPEAAS